MRNPALHIAVVLAFCGGGAAGFAQDVKNGQRLSEHWCSECHAIGPDPGQTSRVISFAAIAARQDITSEMISSFLLMPHSTMPNHPLRLKDARDIAAFIIGMKR